MSKHLERDLDKLQQDLLALASSVEEAIHKATHALQDREPRLAQEVIDGYRGLGSLRFGGFLLAATENHSAENHDARGPSCAPSAELLPGIR